MRVQVAGGGQFVQRKKHPGSTLLLCNQVGASNPNENQDGPL
jgi:hypothetical protein